MARRGNHELTFSLSKDAICRNDEAAAWIYLFVRTILKVAGYILGRRQVITYDP